MTRARTTLFGAILTMTMNAQAQDILPFKATEKTLPNGLKVIVVPTGLPNLVALHIPVQTGSRNEVEPGKSGFAHFFEHMFFRGTEQYPPEKYQQILTRTGARQNAFTTDDFTNYHVTFAKEDLETILEIEADRFQNLSYPEEAFKTEARAVLGEYNKNSANPISKLLEVQRDHAYGVHPYKHTTMGFLKDIEDMPNQFAYSRTFFQRWYRPDYTTLIVAGDVTPEAVLPLVEKYWGGWKSGQAEVAIPAEPSPAGPVVSHVPWETPTLPWVAVAFHGPAFSETEKDFAAIDLLFELTFGSTSELYKRLVEDEQKVDTLFPYAPPHHDPYLVTVGARLKQAEDAVYVRDEILKTFAAARARPVDPRRLADARANARYGLIRSLDTTEAVAQTLAYFVHFRRAYETLNRYYQLYDALTPADLQAAARKYFTDQRAVLTTLSHEPLPEAVRTLPPLARLEPETAAPAIKTITTPTALPLITVKLLFRAGSAHDPAGKEGLSALAASMLAEAGSRDKRIDEIKRGLFPLAAEVSAQVDKEMTIFTLGVHRDKWEDFAALALPMILEPGYREEDFRRLKDAQRNALEQDLRANNEEELGRERLQANVFAGTPYGHTVLGTLAGIDAITLDDVKDFVRRAYTRAGLTLGLAGDLPPGLADELRRRLGELPEGPALPEPAGIVPHQPRGIQVEIIQKETRATAISFGHPIKVTRSHPDFPALYLARTWLGEHRSSMSHLYQRIREVRGMNYGDYAYIEAFPRAMFQFFPDPQVARRAQIFEVWIRPVMPAHAHLALRIAVHELDALITQGLSPEAFEATRNYLLKSVFLLTASQDQQLGYALDSDWYGIPEFTSFMRERLSHLTREDVNRAIRQHLSARDFFATIITKDAQALRDALVSDAPSPVTYDAEKPPELLAEDKIIGARKLGLRPESVRITPATDVFSR